MENSVQFLLLRELFVFLLLLFRIKSCFLYTFKENIFNSFSAVLWKKLRKVLQTYFRKNLLSRKMCHINQLVQKHANGLEKHVDGDQFDVGSYMEMLSFDAIVGMLMIIVLSDGRLAI